MAEMGAATSTWHDELASLMDDTGVLLFGEPATKKPPETVADYYYSPEPAPVKTEEGWKEHTAEFLKAWGELMLDLGKAVKNIVQQSFVTEDSFVVNKVGKPLAKITSRFEYLNELILPEDRDPAHAWPIILFVFVLAVAVLSVNTSQQSSVPPVKRVRVYPPSADRVMLPDGRHLAYREIGVPASRARFSLMAPHSFLSSRLAGIPGVKASLLEEFGIRLVTYDLPGFGESDPHQSRSLNSSAQDMLNLADAVGFDEKFWVLGYSSGSMHSWAALRYIPERIAGAAMFAPMSNPYDPTMTKEEIRGTWAQWSSRRKLMYFLARKFPKFLTRFYRRSFLSGNHGRIDTWMYQPLGKKDGILIEEPIFEEFWHRDVEESTRQGSTKPFIEEAVLQVSSWGFSLADLQVQKKCKRKGILLWLMSMYSEEECELAGFLGPIHIWQGTDDLVVPPSMTEYINRVLPGAILHKLPNEGHLSYFFFCDQCHRQIFSTLFGDPLGPLDQMPVTNEAPLEDETVNESSVAGST